MVEATEQGKCWNFCGFKLLTKKKKKRVHFNFRKEVVLSQVVEVLKQSSERLFL